MAEIINVKVVNNNILALNDYIIKGRPKTFLNAAIASGVSSFTVFNINGFSAGNYYALIGGLDNGNSEIIKMHASTDPTGTTITLASATGKAHDANEPVYFINFNQIEYSHETTGVDAGTSAALGTENIDPSKLWSIYDDTANSTGIAYIRFKNEAGETYSGYSSAAPYTQAEFNTVEYIIRQAMLETAKTDSNGEPAFTSQLTTQYLLDQCNECLRDVRSLKNKLSWTQSYRAILGQTAQGVFAYALSLLSDVYDIYSFKSIDSIKLDGEPAMERCDPDYFFDSVMDNVKFTQVRTAVTGAAGTTTLEIDNSYSFESSGSVQVGDTTITYTGITRSATAGVLTGIPASGDGSMTDSIAVDDHVFQNASEGKPIYWTLLNGIIYINLPNSSWANYNILIDYFKTVTSVDSLDDAIDQIQYDMVKNWLKWKIRAIADNRGVEDLNDPSFLLYSQQKKLHIRKDRGLTAKYFRNNYEQAPSSFEGNPRRWREDDARRF